MLFDLRGKRRRLVQVVYAVLAVLFFVSFIGFGIGSDATGGIFDALGIGGSNTSSSSSSAQFDDQIESAEQKLRQDPKDEKALAQLASIHFQAGKSALEIDEEAQQEVVTDEARTQFDESVQAWERYLKLEPNPNANTAGLVVQSYVYLNDAEGAAKTQQIIADARPSSGSYGNLALYRYFAGDITGGDAAAKKALAEADPATRASTKRQLDQTRELAIKQEKQLKKQSKNAQEAPPGENPLQSPLGGLGGAQPTPQPAP
jgi:tetratricopeptide (TPR) repeat protein